MGRDDRPGPNTDPQHPRLHMGLSGPSCRLSAAQHLAGALKVALVDGLVELVADALEDLKPKLDENKSSWELWKEGMVKIIAGTSQVFDDFRTNVLTSFTDGIGDAFANVLVEGESFGEAMKNLWKNIVSMIISRLVSLGAQLLIFGMIQEAVSKTGMHATVSTKAAETYAGAYASVIAALPFPENLIAAPLVASGEAAFMTANALGLGMAAEGGIFRQPQLVLAGEAGPEAIVPLDRMGEFGGGGQTEAVGGEIEERVSLFAPDAYILELNEELHALKELGADAQTNALGHEVVGSARSKIAAFAVEVAVTKLAFDVE